MINGIAINVDEIDENGETRTFESVVVIERDGARALDLRTDVGNLMVDLDDLFAVLRYYGIQVTEPDVVPTTRQEQEGGASR